MSGRDGVLIEARGLDVAAGGRNILEHIDVAIGAGEVVSIIGPNGAGKTTLVRALLGLIAPTAGAVTRRAGLRVGYVPQRLQIDRAMPLSVRGFLALASAATFNGAAEKVLAEVGVPELMDRPLYETSAGELRRVLLARALLRQPELLVLDEPAQGVDLRGQGEIFALIDRVRRARHAAVLLVSHDLNMVMAATDRVICLNRHVCCAGRPEAVSKLPEYAALFGGDTAANLAIYTHAHDHAHGHHGEVVPIPHHDHGDTAPAATAPHGHG
jgi:zinc transport system ATP-binding protein